MKKNIFLSAILFLVAFTIHAQNDTMYVMKSGAIINKQSIKATDVDSVIFYKPAMNGTFTDPRDGHVYKWVMIGTQVWMAENLSYLPVAASDPSVGLEDEANWETKSTPYYYVYDKDKYGVLYNWYAAQTAAPAGWHLPSDAEWTTLSTYLGGESVAGGKMKSTTGWNSPNTDATNSSGFSALPGGSRSGGGFPDGYYGSLGYAGYGGSWWSSTSQGGNNTYRASFRYLNYNYGNLGSSYFSKYDGYSVRCVRD
jgi:uncharacterized protein (TIGR02145 family)